MQYLLPFLLSFLLTLALMPLVIRLAAVCKCVDIPGKRHLHKTVTPRWGGVAFFRVLPVLAVTATKATAMFGFISPGGIGAIDDRWWSGLESKFAANQRLSLFLADIRRFTPSDV
jgi:UDP-N-acetylmuramyl pentapeptide phosphotransferase/UDP-N-acetylglucosamine-1-phosphate transferase